MNQFDDDTKFLIVSLVLFFIFVCLFGLAKSCYGADCRIEVVSTLEFPTHYCLVDLDADIVIDTFSLAPVGEIGDKTDMIMGPGSWLFALTDGEELLDYDLIIVLEEGVCAIGKDETEFDIYDCEDLIVLEMYAPGEYM